MSRFNFLSWILEMVFKPNVPSFSSYLTIPVALDRMNLSWHVDRPPSYRAIEQSCCAALWNPKYLYPKYDSKYEKFKWDTLVFSVLKWNIRIEFMFHLRLRQSKSDNTISYINYYGHILSQFVLIRFTAVVIYEKCCSEHIWSQFTDKTVSLPR